MTSPHDEASKALDLDALERPALIARVRELEAALGPFSRAIECAAEAARLLGQPKGWTPSFDAQVRSYPLQAHFLAADAALSRSTAKEAE